MTQRNGNWGYLPDYSNQNHTLKFARQSRNSDTYHASERIPPLAYVGVALILAAVFGLVPLIGWLSGAI